MQAHQEAELALEELDEHLRAMELGSIEEDVIKAAKKALVRNWNEHNSNEDQITDDEERYLIAKINEE